VSKVKYIDCCNINNLVQTFVLMPNNWFTERLLDYSQCIVCGAHLLRKRWTYVQGGLHEHTERGCDNPDGTAGKVYKKFEKLLEEAEGELDADYRRAVMHHGGLMQNVHYSASGIVYRSDHILTDPPTKWNGERFMKKIDGRYR
jgi:hypothetical protein